MGALRDWEHVQQRPCDPILWTRIVLILCVCAWVLLLGSLLKAKKTIHPRTKGYPLCNKERSDHESRVPTKPTEYRTQWNWQPLPASSSLVNPSLVLISPKVCWKSMPGMVSHGTARKTREHWYPFATKQWCRNTLLVHARTRTSTHTHTQDTLSFVDVRLIAYNPDNNTHTRARTHTLQHKHTTHRPEQTPHSLQPQSTYAPSQHHNLDGHGDTRGAPRTGATKGASTHTAWRCGSAVPPPWPAPPDPSAAPGGDRPCGRAPRTAATRGPGHPGHPGLRGPKTPHSRGRTRPTGVDVGARGFAQGKGMDTSDAPGLEAGGTGTCACWSAHTTPPPPPHAD